MEAHYVDNSVFIETVSEITAQVVTSQFGGTETEQNEVGETRYTETAQDFFNEKYDEIEYLLNNIMGVYSDTEKSGEQTIECFKCHKDTLISSTLCSHCLTSL
jgi:hypothetical protein